VFKEQEEKKSESVHSDIYNFGIQESEPANIHEEEGSVNRVHMPGENIEDSDRPVNKSNISEPFSPKYV